MATLWLDYQQYRPFRWVGPVLLMMASAALILITAYYLELNNKVAGWEEKLELTERGYGMRVPDGSHEPEGWALEVQHANEVVRQLTLPWEKLFQTVEAAGSSKVALLALEPDMEKQVVKISGEARSLVALLDYIARLEEQEVFGPVYLQSHQVRQQDPDKPVRFSLLAVWRGQT